MKILPGRTILVPLAHQSVDFVLPLNFIIMIDCVASVSDNVTPSYLSRFLCVYVHTCLCAYVYPARLFVCLFTGVFLDVISSSILRITETVAC